MQMNKVCAQKFWEVSSCSYDPEGNMNSCRSVAMHQAAWCYTEELEISISQCGLDMRRGLFCLKPKQTSSPTLPQFTPKNKLSRCNNFLTPP